MYSKEDDRGQYQCFYESVSEWKEEITDHWNCHHPSFYGGYTSVEEAYKASMSCNKYSDRINQVCSKLVAMIQASMPDRVLNMDVTGLDFDTGLALSGVPECWITQTPSKDPKVVKILFNMRASAGNSVEQIIQRGVVISALIKCLEIGGVATEVTVAAGGNPTGRTQHRNGVQYFVKLKKADDYFDLEKFSFAICDAGFYRKMGFSWVKSKAKNRVMEMMNETHWEEVAREYDLYLGEMHLSEVGRDLNTTKEWIIAQCRKYGVEITNPPLA